MMAGRNASCSHVAFTSTRVMATCAVMGQAAGTAAALCIEKGLPPRQLANDSALVRTLQQSLLRDDQTIKNLKNEDPLDLARIASVKSSDCYQDSKPENVIDGYVRDMYGELNHRWLGLMGPDGAWIELSWEKPREIRHVQFTFDTGFHRELTLSSSDSVTSHMVRAPQPETVKDYVVKIVTDSGKTVEVARVSGNHQRLCRHSFDPVRAKSVRLEVSATNGSEQARVYEIRCYG
jgi:hypothetical protein